MKKLIFSLYILGSTSFVQASSYTEVWNWFAPVVGTYSSAECGQVQVASKIIVDTAYGAVTNSNFGTIPLFGGSMKSDNQSVYCNIQGRKLVCEQKIWEMTDLRISQAVLETNQAGKLVSFKFVRKEGSFLNPFKAVKQKIFCTF